MKRNVLLYGICFSCFLLFACAYKGPLVTPDRLVYSSREMLEILVSRFGTDFPLEIKVPYDSNSTLDAYAMDTIRLHTTDEEKFNMIVDSIFSGSLELAYEQNETNTAIETFATSQGNCLSLTNLFIALSRHAGLETFYVEVLDNVSWTAEGRLVYNNGHIVAGMKIYKLRINNKKFPTNLITVDFYPSRPKKYRKLKPIDDLTAVTYYYNNMGVHLLQQKKHIQALHLFNNLLKLNRAQDKVYNNLGVTYSRMGDYTRAIASYEKGHEYNPESISLLSNLVNLCEYVNKPQKQAYYEKQLAKVNNTNPYYFLERANQYLLSRDFTAFNTAIDQAKSLNNKIPDIYLLYVKYHLLNNEPEKAEKNLVKAEKLKADQENLTLFKRKIDYYLADADTER